MKLLPRQPEKRNPIVGVIIGILMSLLFGLSYHDKAEDIPGISILFDQMHTLEYKVYDLKFRIRGPLDTDEINRNVVLLDYDDETEEWEPFPPIRTRHAEIIKALAKEESRPDAVFFDIFFFDPFGRRLDEDMADVFYQKFDAIPAEVDKDAEVTMEMKSKMYEAYTALNEGAGPEQLAKAREAIDQIATMEDLQSTLQFFFDTAAFLEENADMKELAPDVDAVLYSAIEDNSRVYLAQIVNNEEPTPYGTYDILFDQEVHDAFSKLILLSDRTQTATQVEVKANFALRNLQPEDYQKLLDYSEREEVDGKKPLPFSDQVRTAIKLEMKSLQLDVDEARYMNEPLGITIVTKETEPFGPDDILSDKFLRRIFERLLLSEDRSETETHSEVLMAFSIQNMRADDYKKLLKYHENDMEKLEKEAKQLEKDQEKYQENMNECMAQGEYPDECQSKFEEPQTPTQARFEADLKYCVERGTPIMDCNRIVEPVIPRFTQEAALAMQAELEMLQSESGDLPDKVDRYPEELVNTPYSIEEIQKYYRVLLNMKSSSPFIAEKSAGVGYVKPEFQKYDGTIRTAAPFSIYRDRFFPHIDTMLVMHYLKVRPEDVRFYKDKFVLRNCHFPGKEKIEDMTVPLYRKGTMLVNWAGLYTQPNQFPHRSYRLIFEAAEIYNLVKKAESGQELNPVEQERLAALTDEEIENAKEEIEFFKGKISMTGLTAAGTHDLNPVPFHARYPLVGMHANLVNTMLNGLFIYKASFTVFFIVILALGIFTGFFGGFAKQAPGAIVTAVTIIGYGGVSQMLFNGMRVWLPFVPVLFSLVATYLLVVIYRFMTEGQEAKKMKEMFGTYVNPSVVDTLIQNPEMLQLGGKRMDLSAIFALAKGPGLETDDAEELVDRLNEYFTSMTDCIFNYDGTLDKYEGSIIMAIYGAPLPFEDHPAKACLACVDMKKALAGLQEKWKEEGKEPIFAVAGLNSGPMIAGNMGSASRFNYTVMGDSVNLAARILGAAIQYGVDYMISEYMYERAKDAIVARLVDSIIVVGKEEPVEVYEIVAAKDDVLPDDLKNFLEAYKEAFSLYQSRKWDEAIALFEKAKQLSPDDKPSDMLLNRCKQYKESPPSDGWRGEYRLTSKGL